LSTFRAAESKTRAAPRVKDPAFVGESLTFKSGNRSVPALGSSQQKGLGGLEFLSTLAAELSRGQVDLPCFPNVVIKIREALNDPRTSIERTVKLVGAEPGLSARLLHLANSAAFNPTGKRVTELRSAITRLGQMAVQGAAMAYAVQHMKDAPALRAIAKPLSELWKESITVAAICQIVARSTRVQPDEAFLVGLLHGVGRLYIIAHAVGRETAVAEDLMSSDMIADWHPSIGKAVLENWQTGEEFALAVNDQRDYLRRIRDGGDLTDVLIVSLILSGAISQESVGELEMKGVNSFKAIAFSSEDCAVTIKQGRHQLTSLQEALGC
jgi:HD-like signal output (HDOD) protein